MSDHEDRTESDTVRMFILMDAAAFGRCGFWFPSLHKLQLTKDSVSTDFKNVLTRLSVSITVFVL